MHLNPKQRLLLKLKRNKIITFFGFFLVLIQPLFSQYSDGFESGINNWVINTNRPSAVLQASNFAKSGNGSLQLFETNSTPPNGYVSTSNANFSGAFGIYEMFLFGDLSNNNGRPSLDINFIFQNQSNGNHYTLQMFPIGTDGNGNGSTDIFLTKTINNVRSVIASGPNAIPANRWFKLTIDRKCNGDIVVFIDDQEIFSVNDFDIVGLGGIGLGVWHRDAFLDDFTFLPYQGVLVPLDEKICEGENFEFGPFIESNDGNYTYTLPTFDNTINPSAQCVYNLELEVQPPSLTILDTTICKNESINVLSSNFSNEGNFLVLGQSSIGCDSNIVINLYHHPTFLFGDISPIDTLICISSNFTTDLLQNNGFYYDQLKTTEGCDSLVPYKVSVIGDNFKIGDDVKFCPSEDENITIGIELEGALRYFWSNGRNTPTIEIDTLGTYTVTVVTTSGCNLVDSVQVTSSCFPEVFIPSGFSPNNDGLNDTFGPIFRNLDDVENLEFYIFDRWGSVVFFTDNPRNLWDGLIEGRQAQQGVYVWSLSFFGNDTYDYKYFQKGDITLLY